ncbi:MAG: type II toxin-antitoxin system RelE/ParE family toxin [Lachnospiraceae bacterium]
MHRYNIKITYSAEQDLENAADYIAFHLKNPPAATNTVKGIRRQIDTLQTFPERNELDEDPILSNYGVRRDYYKNYKIFYIVENDTIYIIRILHMLADSRSRLYRTLKISDDF